MPEPPDPPLIGPANHPGHDRGLGVGCAVFLLGVVVSCAVAAYVVRNKPDRVEVNEALYWDGLFAEWCCGGSLLSAVLAIAVGLWAANRAGKRCSS